MHGRKTRFSGPPVFLTSDNTQLSESNPFGKNAGVESRAINCKVRSMASRPGNCESVSDPGAINCTPSDPVSFYLEAATAKATRRAYASDLRHFQAWGGAVPATPDLIAAYLASYAATLSVATLRRRLASLSVLHQMNGYESPCGHALVRRTLRGIRRKHGRPQRQAYALSPGELKGIVATMGESIRDVRDRAILLFGYAGAFRRSELVAINVADLTWTQEGLLVQIPRSKRDPFGRGRTVTIPFTTPGICAAAALHQWLIKTSIVSGAVFRPVSRYGNVASAGLSSRAVSEIIKERAEILDITRHECSGNSLRAGFVTAAAAGGLPLWKIMAHTGHASESSLRTYIRRGISFRANLVPTILK